VIGSLVEVEREVMSMVRAVVLCVRGKERESMC